MAITLERLKELLHYDPSTGKFTWRVQRTGRGGSKPGDIAGTVHGARGYLRVVIDRERLYLHRLAWMYVYGAMPIGVVDHINRNPSDNRIVNLRDTTPAVNSVN